MHYVESGRGVPVIFVHGSLSDYTYWHIDERLSQLLPVNQRVEFPDTGHQMWLAHPDLCRNAVLAFLQGNGIS